MAAKPWTYLPSTPGGALEADPAFYDRLARETDRRTPVDAFVIPIRSGRAWPVRAGQLCRVVVIEGPQVADFNGWNLHNPRERFWAARTKQLDASHVTTGDRLWSCLPVPAPDADDHQRHDRVRRRRGRRALPRPARHALRPLREQAADRGGVRLLTATRT